jgi:hypothetical protein
MRGSTCCLPGRRFTAIEQGEETYTLTGRDGKPYASRLSGTLGGHRRNKVYGRLDCPSALRWIARGYYVRHRVFFIDEQTAIAAGHRPCAVCLPERYAAWKSGQRVPPVHGGLGEPPHSPTRLHTNADPC